ncbi:hypothetical protein [Algoriphagus antarcticus]|uniref:Uncharacterized protein n=1 Tax=Algoriphagus antarcticus TaxID=238540 RepID=A0A3E0DW65_9BACT|nr:hypothetical protein [Algoriphagus antarcticus]REG87065.1 hypothetical protein C8N25_11144 [Algoriphagus antarcticus]
MGAISTCRLLGEDHFIKLVQLAIGQQISKGIVDPKEMVADLWRKLMNQGVNYESALVYIGNYMRFLPVLISKYKGSGVQEKIDIVKNISADSFSNFMFEMDIKIGDQANPIDTIEKLDAYIQRTFVEPVLGKREEELPEENKKGNVDPEIEEEIEPEPDLLFEEEIENEVEVTETVSNHVVNNEVGLRYIASRMAKQSYIAVEKFGQIVAFHYDSSTQTFQEISADLQRTDIIGNELSLNEFMDSYVGSPMVSLPTIIEKNRQDKESRNSNLRDYYGRIIQRFKDSKSIVTFFGNAIKAKSREHSIIDTDSIFQRQYFCLLFSFYTTIKSKYIPSQFGSKD